MARMTEAEAVAVNTVIDYIAEQDRQPPAEVVRSLHLLASGASDRLEGGWSEDAVRRQWPDAVDEVQQAPADPTDPPIVPDTPVNPA